MSHSQVKGFMERVISNMSTQHFDNISSFHCADLGFYISAVLERNRKGIVFNNT